VCDPGCLELAELHSRAVDYPKTGAPVEFWKVSKHRPPLKPDWYASEVVDPENGDYYESFRALGVLFRNIRLDQDRTPVVNPNVPKQRDIVKKALTNRVNAILRLRILPPVGAQEFDKLFHQFSYEVKYQCVTHKLSQNPNGRLREEEVILGTILGKTTAAAESRKRRLLVDRLGKQSRNVTHFVKTAIAGGFSDPAIRLDRAWKALDVAYEFVDHKKFGAKGFALVCLSSVLDALDLFDEN